MSIRFGQIELDEQRLLLQRDGIRLQIRPKVFDLLVHLVRHRERVVLRDELIMALWGTTAVGLGSLSGLVNELRQVLGEAGRGPSSIRTVHARGYQFVGEIQWRDFGQPPLSRSDPGSGAGRDRGGATTSRLGPFGRARGLIRTSFAPVSTGGARAVIVVGPPGSARSSLLDHAAADMAQVGFEIHRLAFVTRSERRPNALVDRLIDTLVEHYGMDAIRSATPVHARELRERVGRARPGSKARPRDPLGSHQYEERVWRNAAELLRELAQQRPLALLMDDRDQTATAATLVVLPLLRLLGKARVFILCTAGAEAADESVVSDSSTPGIEYLRFAFPNRGQLNELLESRGVAALPMALADALVAHVRDDKVSLESVVDWLQAERDRGEQIPNGPALPSIDRRMKRVEPDPTSRRSRFGTA